MMKFSRRQTTIAPIDELSGIVKWSFQNQVQTYLSDQCFKFTKNKNNYEQLDRFLAMHSCLCFWGMLLDWP